MSVAIEVDKAAVQRFCEKWRIREFALFGSVIRDDFGPDSDIDVLVTLGPAAEWDLFDWIELENELAALFGRPVDVVEKSAIRNPYRRKAILADYEVIHGA